MDLHIESYEGGIYLVAVEKNGERQYLSADSFGAKTFYSTSQIKALMSQQDYDKVWLHQKSAYDEMIGCPPSSESLRLQLHW